jgi:hypothetical protein
MANVLIHRADELKPQTRAAVEAELGRRLADDEDVSIMAFALHDAPTGEDLKAARQGLEKYLKRADSLGAGVPEGDAEEALGEALRNARPGYRERQ